MATPEEKQPLLEHKDQQDQPTGVNRPPGSQIPGTSQLPPGAQQLPPGSPQHPQQEPPNQQQDDNGCCKTMSCACIFYTIFYLLCSLTGLYFPNQNRWKRCGLAVLITWSSVFLVAFVLLNFGSLAFDIYVIAVCPFQNCSYVLSYTKWWTIVNSRYVQSFGLQPEQEQEFKDWQKTVLITASISGLLSYCFMIFVLVPQYSFLKPLCDAVCDCHAKLWKWCGEKDYKSSASAGTILSPFEDSGEEATQLTPRQTFYFHVIFWLNLVLFISNFVLFCIILQTVIASRDSLMRRIDIAGLIAQFGSHFCAIQSCFIFSKVTYAVSNKCRNMINSEFKKANVPFDGAENSENHHQEYIAILQEMDKKYTDMVKATLEPYGTWFAVHWVLYTLTAFMSVAYFTETVTQELYADTYICRHEHTAMCRLNLAFVFLLTLEHCILFLYPCFRAASVTAARGILIKEVSEASWTHIPHTVKDSFIKYLESRKSGFKLSILCTKIDFGYNIAYLSIFVGIFGVILKLSF